MQNINVDGYLWIVPNELFYLVDWWDSNKVWRLKHLDWRKILRTFTNSVVDDATQNILQTEKSERIHSQLQRKNNIHHEYLFFLVKNDDKVYLHPKKSTLIWEERLNTDSFWEKIEKHLI